MNTPARVSAATKNKPWIIGLTGKNATGKGEAAQFIARSGYLYRSLSDILREEASSRKLDPSREVLITLGRELRESGGPGVLAARTVPQLTKDRYVIDSIRNPAEIDILKTAGNFFLLGIDAPIELRFERASKRGRIENASTIDEFRKIEDRERSDNALAQQLDHCLQRADKVILNDSSLKHLEENVREVLIKAGFPLEG